MILGGKILSEKQAQYYEVNRNILEYLYVSIPCYNAHCAGLIAVSLHNLYKEDIPRCPVCHRECGFHFFEKRYLDGVYQSFGNLYKQLESLELLPLGYSPGTSPKTLILYYKPEDNTFDNLKK